MGTPICPIMSKLVVYGDTHCLEAQLCIGSECAAWRPGMTAHMGSCGMADGTVFNDPSDTRDGKGDHAKPELVTKQ